MDLDPGLRVLVVNVGSSTIKLSLLDDDDTVLHGVSLRSDAPDDAIEAFLGEAGAPDVIAHRVVHGGPDLVEAVRIDDDILERLEDAALLAPLHDPPAIAMIRRLLALHPTVPAVACFDTTFHAGIGPALRTYAIPKRWREAGVRRYGFHGLSHAYASRRAAELLAAGARPDRPSRHGLRLVVCHLGAGASACATRGGRSVDTTMGFTPVEGLVMATRSGDVDPGALMWIQQQLGMSAETMNHALNHESGLHGLTGTADMAEITRRATEPSGNPQPPSGRRRPGPPTDDRGRDDAIAAVTIYATRVAKAVAALVVPLGGIDGLVFTGGVGEHEPLIRAAAADHLAFLGVGLGPANETVDVDRTGDEDVSRSGAAVRTLVVRAREDLEMARSTRMVLASP